MSLSFSEIAIFKGVLSTVIAAWHYEGPLECLPIIASEIALRSQEKGFRARVCQLIPNTEALVNDHLLHIAEISRKQANALNLKYEDRPLEDIVRIWDAWIALVDLRIDIFFEEYLEEVSQKQLAYRTAKSRAIRKSLPQVGRFFQRLTERAHSAFLS